MKRLLFGLLAATIACVPIKIKTQPPNPPAPAAETTEWRTVAIHLGVGSCAVTLSQAGQPVATQTSQPDGYTPFQVAMRYISGYPAEKTLNLSASATCPGYQLWTVSWVAATHGNQDVCAGGDDCGPNQGIVVAPVVADFPDPLTREEILASHESFQGAKLHTSCYGDLYWWPTAFSSLSAACREEAYPQIASWGDTDITVSASWNYGEPGQPYGTGQLVPNTDFLTPANRLATDFRSLVKEVIRHKSANGKPFVPRIFMEGDNGYAYYMWAEPLIVAALKPQPNDPIDLTRYVKLQVCYDSCVPGWAGSNDDKTLIADALLKTREDCPNCVIALEFSSGYTSTGDGDAFWNAPAGQAIDEVDWEGNSWPVSNFDQYWQVLARFLGPAYVRPAAQPADDDPGSPFPEGSGKFYLFGSTPRGPWVVHCFEPYTFQWVRGSIDQAQVPAAFAYMQSLGCPVIDAPYVGTAWMGR